MLIYKKNVSLHPEKIYIENMVLFYSDYLEGCIPEILSKLAETNFCQTPGYGKDSICAQARETIKKVCQCPDADVHFLVGGTQTNATVIASVLRPYQGVACASTGHIAVHETGAIEHSAHKVLTLPSANGKINSKDLECMMAGHFNQDSPEHEVQPAMCYISYPTELGTLYSKEELLAIKAVCTKWNIPLFVDGARLGYGLVARESDITIADLAAIADIFYIGGTKQGSLFGEAVVINNPAYKKDFRYHIKQNGGLLAKGRLLGLQFQILFENDLYMKYAAHAVELAQKLAAAFKARGYEMYAESPTNQIFPILSAEKAKELAKDFGFEKWCDIDAGHTAVRFCTSWATCAESVDDLISRL